MAEQTSSSHPLFEYQRSILTMEIEYIHSQIAHFDTLSFQIKGWTVTIWAAIIAFGSTQQVIVVVLSSIPAVLTFWVLDAFFKTYQGRLMSRMGAIEAFLDSDWCFKEKGLREAFQSQDFGQFPIHDPICRRTRELRHVSFVLYSL